MNNWEITLKILDDKLDNLTKTLAEHGKMLGELAQKNTKLRNQLDFMSACTSGNKCRIHPNIMWFMLDLAESVSIYRYLHTDFCSVLMDMTEVPEFHTIADNVYSCDLSSRDCIIMTETLTGASVTYKHYTTDTKKCSVKAAILAILETAD